MSVVVVFRWTVETKKRIQKSYCGSADASIASPNIIKMMLVEGEHRPLPPQLDQGVASLCEQAEQLSARMPRNSKQAGIQVARQTETMTLCSWRCHKMLTPPPLPFLLAPRRQVEIILTYNWDVAEWLERLVANSKVATVLGSIPSDTVESEGRQMKQCWIQYIEKKKNLKNPPCFKYPFPPHWDTQAT